MIDVVDRITRSRMMSGIRGKNTQPELALRRALHREGFRYRLHAPDLPGSPDIVLPKHKSVVEVRGCFWHRHERCIYCTTPSSNKEFWRRKFNETVKRDERNRLALRRLGWRIAIVWECSVKNNGANVVAERLKNWLQSGSPFKQIPSRARAK
ncbi:very short patch repair endonuclease [Bradyrhizobium elkanii]|uniref:very short patch repair endonuclease n=1 Tax=Bradyrhizobium elkanii TaxID=29448 RepID=UPI001BA8216E|nr:DNA mismatch endonuclease Vsr [Bradyrhizobium elkanii]MBR1161004.1 DNA mismatch endonuclease Vsr [Bradyrhizobium elkanii]